MLAKIKKADYIVLSVDNTTVALGNALYSYIVSLQKKVTLFAKERIETRFACLPWYEKVRYVQPLSADEVVELELDTLAVFKMLEAELPRINEKMTTALYTSFLIELQQSSKLLQDGMKLAAMAQLTEYGAKADLCIGHLFKREPLAVFRLRALVFGNFVLTQNANVVHVEVTQQMLNKSGATLAELYQVAKELLRLVHVCRVKVNFENETIFEIEEV